MKKYYLQTFGCQMNKSDSERLKTILESAHFSETVDEKKADIILLNTCSVRKSAEDRICGLMHNFAKLREKKPALLLGLTGCMVGHDTEKKFLKILPMVDLYFPISEIEKLPTMIAQLTDHSTTLHNNLDSPISYLNNVTPSYSNPFEASVPIMSGCNNFCTYCIVPYARGRETSRSFRDILSEIQRLKESDVQYVTLLGQNVNSFHPNDTAPSKENPYKNPFAALLWEINKIAIPWVFFTAPHPENMHDEVIDALTLPCMVDYIHLPLQSGDDHILEKMNRHYTAKEYGALIQKIRAKKPHIAIGTDIIVGFPGETKVMFNNTLKLYKEVEFDISYHAVYSPRPKTLAAKMEGQVPYGEKRERWKTLQALMEKITHEKNRVYKDTIEEVLIREKTKNGYIGETRHIKKISLPLTEGIEIGKRYKAQISKTSTWMLWGNIV